MFEFATVPHLPSEPQVVEKDGKRLYKFPTHDKYYPSVTTVTGIHSKKSIMEWRKRVGEDTANKISSRATSRGNAFHAIVEEYFKGTLDLQKYSNNPLAQNLFRCAKTTLNRISDIHCLETPLYSDLFCLAGRVDCIARFDNELAVIDFKTSTKEKKESWIENYFVQETAYAAMFYELTGIKVTKIVTLIATEEGSTQIIQKYNIDDYLQVLKRYIREYNAQN